MKPAPVIMHSLKHCLEKLISNLGYLTSPCPIPLLKKTQQQQTGDNDVIKKLRSFVKNATHYS